MHAVVEIAGKQFRVSNKVKIKVPLLSTKEGEKVNFDKVHMLEDDKGNITFGDPLVSNMSVGATVLEHGRDKKIIVFKKKRRKGYQKKNGHRQGYSLIEINTISASKSTAKKTTAKIEEKAEVKAPKKEAAKKTEAAAPKKVAPKKVAPKKAAPKKTETKPAAKKETTKKAATATKPKATKAATKSQASAKKAEPKPKAKED